MKGGVVFVWWGFGGGEGDKKKNRRGDVGYG